MLRPLSRVGVFVGHKEEVRVILLLTDDQITEIDGSSNHHRVNVVDSHAVGVAEVGNAPHVFEFGHVGEEAHTLQPAIAEGFIDRDGQLEGQKFIENGSEQIHPSIFPKPPILVKQLMPKDVGNCSQFVVGTPFVELYDGLHDIVCQGKPFTSDVLVSPEFDFVVWI